MFSKKILVVFIVYFTFNLSHGQRDVKFFRNDYTYLEATQSFYKINSLTKNFFEAKRACSLEGASLWYPENQKEADVVISYWNSTKPTWWTVTLGLSDLLVKGLFETIDGKPVANVYHNWNIGEPNYRENEDCVAMTTAGKMDYVLCDEFYHYICKKTLASLEWNERCNMPDLDYRYNNKSGKCYKAHSVPLNWIDAYNVCSSEQSHLPIVESLSQVENLVPLIGTETINWDAGSYLRGIYHLGFHNRFNEGWQTIKGTPINVDPSNGIHDQCGAMFDAGRLTQIDCSLKCFFICEHEVNPSSQTVDEDDTQINGVQL